MTSLTRLLRLASFAALVACGSAAAVQADNAPHPIRTSKPAADVLRKELTPIQFEVTQQNGTEPPFRNAYFDNHAAGIYVDVTTGQPLFSSLEKFESGTGWPSFWKPIAPGVLFDMSDKTHGMDRQEVRSKIGDAHLGHVFDDGPKPTGLRYCINSASLRFVPVDQLVAQGYGSYKAAFDAVAKK